MDPVKIRKLILEKIPEGSVIPRHNEEGHFYEVAALRKTFPSVTGKLQILKDEGLMNWKMDRALDYIFQHHKEFTEENVMDHLAKAAQVPVDLFHGAGDVGKEIHEARERYFRTWITLNQRPEDVLAFMDPATDSDVRIISALNALEKFCVEKKYIPVVTEQYVYDVKLEVAGTLDDIGIITENGKQFLVLMDLKTSNSFKSHYFFQVATYWMMFVKLTGLEPKHNIILKLSKTDQTYSIEELLYMQKLVFYAKNMLRTNAGLEFIKKVRKDNQKNVATI